MGHEWKIGDWAEYRGARYLVVKAWSRGDCQFVNAYSGSGAVRTFSIGASNIKHLPECTGWEWEPPKPVEPTARKWEFGDWAMTHIGNNLRFVSVDSDGDFMFVEKSGDISAFNAEFLVYLPECTGFDWTPPSPVKQIEPPTGYRLLGRDEVVADGDLFIKRAPAGNDYDWRTASGDSCCTVGYFVDSFEIVCFARKIEPRYRPFANAAEFEPFAEKWICRSEMGVIKPGAWKVIGYSDKGIYSDSSVMLYADAFDMLQFKDGTRFGVLDTKE